MRFSLQLRAAAIILALGVLAGCQQSSKALIPVPRAVLAQMKKLDMDESAPIYIRIFKEESQLEVWKKKRDGQYALLKTYEICKWSGEIGPKIVEGDRQAPEGFYTVTPAQMNPNSSYYLSFNIGYPNAYDQALGRTGSNLMVHGACSSAGCYSMTDEYAGELFALAREAFKGGQTAFQVHAFPFRMTPENMAKHRDNPNYAFWRMLKEGYDNFEVTHVVPTVDVCEKRYVFNADANGAAFNARGSCPAFKVPDSIRIPVAAKQANDDKIIASLVKADKPAVAATPIPAKAPDTRRRAEIATASVTATSKASASTKTEPAKTEAAKSEPAKTDDKATASITKASTGTSDAAATPTAAATAAREEPAKKQSMFDSVFGVFGKGG